MEEKAKAKWGNNPDYIEYLEETPKFFPKIFKLRYFFILFCISISMAQKTESQPYELIEKYENIEIRYYPPAIKVISKGKIEEIKTSETFFNYISGSNSKNEKISMTTPVYEK